MGDDLSGMPRHISRLFAGLFVSLAIAALLLLVDALLSQSKETLMPFGLLVIMYIIGYIVDKAEQYRENTESSEKGGTK